MTSPVVLFLLVAYGNMDEVDGFIDHLRTAEAQRGVGEVRFAISDNHSTSQPSANAGQPDVVVVTRPDNPGYLDGGRAALAAAEARWPDSADWVILTNADLELRGATLTEVLATHDPARPAVLAPRITEGPENVEKNPHVLSPRTPSRLRLNHVASRKRSSTNRNERPVCWCKRRDRQCSRHGRRIGAACSPRVLRSRG